MKNIVYFDLETQKSADEVGGWNRVRDMRMSVGVTYSTARGDYKIYTEPQVDQLINELMRADLVVGFNNLRFDYEVLHGYTALDLTQIPTLDMLVQVQKVVNHRLSLDAIAGTTLGVEKTSELRREDHQTRPRVRRPKQNPLLQKQIRRDPLRHRLLVKSIERRL
jgi:DEAD/DEAH box helicase domain-containing protein